MGLLSRSIESLYNGVSQQPATIRLPNQCEEQINAWGTVVDGLRKRAPTIHIAQVSPTKLAGAHLHSIDRDVDEKYDVVVSNGNVQVFDKTGNAHTVSFPAGKTYLNVPAGKTAEETFALVTVADFTFIVNKSVTVKMAALNADTAAQNPSYWWLNRSQQGDGTGAQQLQYPPNQPISGYAGVVQSFQDLPENASVGALYQIQGTADDNFASYYVIRGAGVWNECRKPGIQNLLDNTTMPHALVRLGDGTFVFAPFSWAPRRVGDLTTNPNPSFVGRQIRDVFFYRNRLCLTVDENVTMSRVGDFGNFFRLTVTALLPDETIDIATSETQVTPLNYAVPMGGELMVFSDEVQFRINHAGVVAPNSLSIEAATHYAVAPGVRPVNLGSDVYFAAENGDNARVYEYFLRQDSTSTDASEITGHVPTYIPAGVRKIVGSPDHDALFVLTAGEPNRIYVYKFYWASETEKAQSAWSYWEFGPEDVILSASVFQNELHILLDRPNGCYYEKIPLAIGANAPSLPFQVYLDRRCTVQGTYVAASNSTVFALPYSVHAAEQSMFRVIRTDVPGALIDTAAYTFADEQTLVVRGSFAAKPCIIGRSYTMRYTFSEQFVKDQQNNATLTGRLQLRTFTVYYTDTAFFRTEVAPYGADVEQETIVPALLSEFSGKTLGDQSLILGQPAFHTGSYAFQIYGDSDVARVSLTNDSHLASNFQAAEWEGFYQNRARYM